MTDSNHSAAGTAAQAPFTDPEVDGTHQAPSDSKKHKGRSSKRHYAKSHKEAALDRELRQSAGDGRFGRFVSAMLDDTLLATLQNYANVVSIQRLGYNDHGPVHSRIVALNCLRLFELLEAGGVTPSIVAEEVGDREDALIAVFCGAFLHDIGMTVTRDDHEQHSVILAEKFILKHLGEIYEDEGKNYILKSVINECIIGHMGHYKVNSVEAGIVMVGDGADCTRGRAMIPSQIAKNPMLGDIHRFSATAIQSVSIHEGVNKPVRIDVYMNSSAGLFQVEEVLIGKAKVSPIMNYLEIAAHLEGKERLYLR